MKLMITLLLSLMLTGCFCKEKIVYQEVKVVVPGKVVAPPKFRKPHLPIHEITKETPDDIVGAAYYESIKILENEVDKRDKALKVYEDSANQETPTNVQVNPSK